MAEGLEYAAVLSNAEFLQNFALMWRQTVTEVKARLPVITSHAEVNRSHMCIPDHWYHI